MNLEGRTALVTGGAKRVGRAICKALAQTGCHVAIHYHRSASDAESLAEDLRHLGVQSCTTCGDLEDPASWDRIVQETITKLDRLDILVNNASLFLTEEPDDLDGFDPAYWDRMLRVNLTAPVGLVHAARHALQQNKGRVINLLDTSWDTPWSGHLAYGASKAGLAVMTRGLAKTMAPHVRVYGVAPGVAEFPEAYDEAKRQRILARVPLERPGTPEDIAGAIVGLLQHGDYITGEIIRVDGGRHLG